MGTITAKKPVGFQDAAQEILEVLRKHLPYLNRDYESYHLTSMNVDERYNALTLNIIYNPPS